MAMVSGPKVAPLCCDTAGAVVFAMIGAPEADEHKTQLGDGTDLDFRRSQDRTRPAPGRYQRVGVSEGIKATADGNHALVPGRGGDH
jgi:hypothetical protein